jgi:eukaryotic-like serine/threonine-protein kinase
VLSPGALLSERYELTERIAAGGMGEVWRGTDLLLHRPVAVKVLLPGLAADTGFIARFRTEARMMASLRHPGIVQVYDFGEDGSGLDYLVMEFIEGTSLARRIEDSGRLTAAETVEVVGQVADALQTAHEAGIIHRDVKPSNLLVRPGGGIVLVDFGVARSTTGAGLTGTNVVMGSAHYMAPEQAEGKPITPATDVYALGAVAYTCLMGRPPYTGDNPLQVIAQLIVADPPTLPVEVPPQVAAVVLRALEKDPARRHQSAAAFAAAARVALTGQGPSRRAPVYSAGSAAVDRPISPPPAPSPAAAPTEAYGPVRSAASNGVSSAASSAASSGGSNGASNGVSTADPAWHGRDGSAGAAPRAGGRRKIALMASAVLLAVAGVSIALAVRGGPTPAQGRPPGANRIDLPDLGAGAGPGEQKPVALPTSASGRPGPSSLPGTGASARTSSGVGPSATVPVGAEPTATTTGDPAPEPSQTATSEPVSNPYTPRAVCGTAFAVIDQAPLTAADGTLLGRVYLLFNAKTRKNCTVTLKATDVGTATDTGAYLEVEGADRVTDSGSFEYYAGPVKAKADAVCVKWGGSIGGVSYDSAFEHCD